MTNYPIALWSFNLGRAPGSVADFAAQIEEGLQRAAAAGAKLLLLPEYVNECCLAFKPAGLRPDQEMDFLADAAQELIPHLSPLPQKHGVSLLVGTVPVKAPNGITNTAILLTADGREILQDKLCLTPFEQSSDTWSLTPGTELKVFELDGLKMAILICLDVEMPALSSLLARQEIDLLLVPSMTEMLSGYHRVFGCAKARAVELMCAVAACGVVGASKGTTQNESNVSGAALYLPCEEAFGFTGIGAEIAPTDGKEGEEPFLMAEVPLQQLRDLRSGKAEVWPGAWTADHVSVLAG
ncbi:nitrilase-related carbon-nitrogen hydrolase [Labrenzia sp. VG12]|uniref:nitrilase-related carbon-nitrogen hydrolase n=1 Tax=Labrenzia sp. VG12 TaxID=2021862 RepID=UPI000B8C1884|nr:nitrilase-related carbon-nitrogen hydrolase [Labrenzia sp. VG12]ASP32569.1 nitrilase [Labrenzia sp. VG12]